jgi:ribonuclease P protein component
LVLAGGESAVGQFLILRFLKGAVQEPETAFIVSRKIGKAVARNRVRRRLRELFGARMRSSMAPGLYLFIARTGSAGATFKQLEDDAATLVKRLAAVSAPRQENGSMAPSERPRK